jgi:DNA-directed RNA polymerase II subunit RPB1
MAEVKEIMAVPKQIIAPKNNSPVMGIVQDALLSVMLFTYRDTFLELDQVMNLLMWVENATLPTPAIIKPRPLWTGKQILSLVFPDINLKKKGDGAISDSWMSPDDLHVYIKRGEIICGIITNTHVGKGKAGGVIHIIQRDKGHETTKLFMSNLQNLCNNWLVGNGFSVGV